MTLHSYRVGLACQLLEAGASPAQIQAILRWQTDESLRLYARMGDQATGRWLKKAQGSVVPLADVARMPVIDGWQGIHALHELESLSGLTTA